MNFRFEFMTMTQIGECFGVSSHQIGKWLVKIGLRTPANKPSRDAFSGDFVKVGPSRNQGFNYVWHAERTIKALESAGHKLALHPASELLLPCKLNGPFECRRNLDFGYEVVNNDNTVAVWVRGEENAQFICRLLNMADQKGVVERVLGNANAPNAIPMTEAATA